MSPLLAALCAIAVSLAGIGWLLATDEKRRRVFRLGEGKLPRSRPGSRMAGWALVLLPGVALAATGRMSELLIWFGTMTVSSWLIVARVPRRAGAED